MTTKNSTTLAIGYGLAYNVKENIRPAIEANTHETLINVIDTGSGFSHAWLASPAMSPHADQTPCIYLFWQRPFLLAVLIYTFDVRIAISTAVRMYGGSLNVYSGAWLCLWY